MAKTPFDVILIMSAVDKATRVINEMANNAITKLSKVQKNADKFANSAFSFGRNAAVTGAAIAAPFIYATNEAIKFEDQMASVAKVTGMSMGSKELGFIADQVKDTAVYLGVAAEQSAGLYASLAQGGVPVAQLQEVSKIAGEVGVAFELSSEQAGESFIKMQNALGATVRETKKVSDAINYLSDNSAAKASDILEFMAAGGAGVARGYNLAGEQAAAFGVSLIGMGKSGAEAATIMERFAKGMMKNAGTRQIFESVGGGAQGFFEVLRKGAALDPSQQFAYFQQFGEYGNDIRLMASNMAGPGGLVNALKLVGDEQNYLNSVSGEFANKTNTTAGRIRKLKAESGILAIELGEALLPAISDLLKEILPVVKSITEWARRNPGLVTTISKLALGMSALSFAASGVSFLFGGVAKIISFTSTVMSLFSSATRAATLAQWGLNTAVLANPYLAMTVAIVAAIAAIVAMVVYMEELDNMIVNLWNDSGILGKSLMVLAAIINGPIIGMYMIASAIRWVIDNFNLLENEVNNIIQVFVDMGTAMYSAGENIVTSLIDGVKSRASQLIETVSTLAQSVRDFFPFSPARRGPLMDIHRVKLVETIAQSVRPAPLLNAMSGVAASVMSFAPVAAATPIGGGGNGAMNGAGISVVYSPNITISGAAAQGETVNLETVLRQDKYAFEKMLNEILADRERRKF